MDLKLILKRIGNRIYGVGPSQERSTVHRGPSVNLLEVSTKAEEVQRPLPVIVSHKSTQSLASSRDGWR